ncbi:tail fiber protein, partial [Escherichia coli]|uniref:phage tail fiber protein n=1 Tax=Escherichia coli TaxID=562 RepID=UPI003CC81F2B
TAAASSASSAASSASSASASKDEATRQASAAKGSATTASTKATEAAGSATAASQSKTAAESAATRAEAAADRAEEIAGAVAMEDASLTTKGVVKLSSAVDSTSESLAATPKAVKAANDNANSRLAKNQNGADIPDKGRFLSNINAASKTDMASKRGMKYSTVNAPAGVEAGKFYPVVIRRSSGFSSELASRVTISTSSRTGDHRLNNCEFNGFVMPGGWTDRGKYAYGMFHAYTANERAIHSIMMGNKADDLCSVFYVEGEAFPIAVYVEEGLSVVVPSADYVIGQSTYKWGATDPRTECVDADTILDFSNGRGFYSSHSLLTKTDISGRKIYANDEIVARGGNQLRMIGGDYGAFWRNDGRITYLLFTARGDQYGGWNDLRPIMIDNATGEFTIGTKLNARQGVNGNASSATKLQTARKIGGASFDGTADINLPGVNIQGNQNTTGNAATATKLQMARTIGGVSFDGTANINLPGVNTAGNQNTTGNAATATKLQTARNINGVKFDGSGDININTLVSRGRVTALSGSTQGTAGIQMYEAYNNSYPTTYGNVLHMKGASAAGEGELLIGWSGTSGAHAPAFIRSRRDTTDANWSPWAQVYTTAHKPTAKDVGAAQTFSASYNTGAGNWTTAEFIAWLKERGAFEVPYWMMKGSWSYADNKIITDTGVGNICLAGAVIEVLGHEGAMTIRVTTPTTTTGGGIASAQFTYINHGSAYAPAWRRDYNTTLKPTAADVGALPISGGTMNGVLTLQNVSQPLKTQGGGILANDGNLYINKSGFAGWIDALFMKNSGGTMSGQLKIRSTDGLRIYDAAYGMIFRRSENNFYLIPTAKDQGENGDIGSLRPFYVDLTNGRVTMGNGAVVNGGLGLGVVNGLGGNSIVLGDNDTGFKQNGDGILDVYANSAHVFRFVNSTLQSLKPLSVTGDIASSAWVYANRFSINSGSGAWIDMRNQNVIFGGNAVSTNSAQALLRQDHADRKFFLGGLGNSQFGFYMINNSRTANGTDANAYLQNDGTWVCGGNGSFNDVYIRSDRRSKRNIRKIERALDKLDRIEGVLYEIQVCDRYEQSGGLIAQDVQNVQPELVTVDHNDQSGEPRLRLNYNGVIGMLVEAVKELREEVRELKAKM